MDECQAGVKLQRFIKLKDESGTETIHYDTVSKDCPEEVKLNAEKELNETEENKRRGIEKLRAYSKKNNFPELEDVYLIAILRCCKYDIKKSQVRLKKFLNVRKLVLKNIKKLDNEKIEQLIADGFSECLPWSDKQGRPIYVFRPKMNLDAYDYEDMATYAKACLFSVLKYPLPTINGLAVIIDCNLKPPSAIFQLLKEFGKYFSLEKSIPFRIGRLDVMHENVVIHYGFAMIRPFLSSKIQDRIAFHGSNIKTLHRIYHPDLLPDDFGGTLGPIDTTLFKEEKMETLNKLKNLNDIQ